VALSTFSEVVSGAMVVALFTVAVHRPPRTTAAVFGLSVLAGLVDVVARPEPGTALILLFVFGVVVQGAAVGWRHGYPGRHGRTRTPAGGGAGGRRRPLVRAGLVLMLGGAGDLRVVAEAGDGTQALAMVDRHAPLVVLMDIRMPTMDGLAATQALRARRHPPRCSP
jgi:Response regulator receiver domain